MPGTDDVAYHPDSSGGWSALGVPVSDCLVLGDPPPAVLVAAESNGAGVRVANGQVWSALLKRGCYLVRRGDRCTALVVVSGGEPGPPSRGRSRYLEGDLPLAMSVVAREWTDARPARTSAPVAEGDLVRVRSTSALGVVRSVTAHMGDFDVVVDGPLGLQTYEVEALERIEGDPRDPAFWVEQRAGSSEDLSLTLTWTKLTHPLTDTVYSFGSSKTVFRAYQFAPVLKLLSSATGRLLIADEVGLGKTIEAGLIWSELEQRERLTRVLVVAPSALALKWKSEMARRFDRNLDLLRPADLLAYAQDMAAGRDVAFAGVVSLESLRTADAALQALTEVHARMDLVVVDEAHALRNRGTRSYVLGQLLSDWADVLLFLSATPLNLGRSDLFNLVNLLREDEFPDEAVFEAQLEPNQALNEVARRLRSNRREPRKLLAVAERIPGLQLGAAVAARPDYAVLTQILDSPDPLTDEEVARAKRAVASLNTLGSVLTRTRKVDVPDAKALRVAEQIDVAWTEQERAMYDGVRARYMSDFLARGVPPGFGMQMPLRQAASCLPAMQQALRRKHSSFLDEYEDYDVEEPSGEDGSAPLDLPPTSLGQLLTPLLVDSKYEAMERRLLQLRGTGLRQVMVFSFFRGTLEYLHERLSQKLSVGLMTGSTPMSQRQQVMEDFRAGTFDVLLLSQVGAEGLDFEFCNVLVNYDLPWNPMQVEQRIGRLDRFGQEHERIFIFNMHVPGTIESDIFERLYTRIGVFEESIGELEPILRDELRDVTKAVLDPGLTDDERRAEAERIGIALAERADQIKELEGSRGALSTVDQLEVDGMTNAGPTDGRFVGPSEVRRLVERLLQRYGGGISGPVRGIYRIAGNESLARAIHQFAPRAHGGSGLTSGQLAAQLRGDEPLRVTFDNDVASKLRVELISSRHPLVRVALNVLDESSLSLCRFGVVGVPALASSVSGCLARVDLVDSTGLRPRLEMWVTAVDLASGAEVDVAAPLLEAVAHGRTQDVEQVVHPDASRLLPVLEDLLRRRRRDIQAQRRADNDALVDARVASRVRSIDLKLERAQATLREVVENARDERVVRLHEGRIRNLLMDRDAVSGDVESGRSLDVSSRAVAVLQLHPV